MTFKFPLATATWDQKEIDAMQNVIATGNLFLITHQKLFVDQDETRVARFS